MPTSSFDQKFVIPADKVDEIIEALEKPITPAPILSVDERVAIYREQLESEERALNAFKRMFRESK